MKDFKLKFPTTLLNCRRFQVTDPNFSTSQSTFHPLVRDLGSITDLYHYSSADEISPTTRRLVEENIFFREYKQK